LGKLWDRVKYNWKHQDTNTDVRILGGIYSLFIVQGVVFVTGTILWFLGFDLMNIQRVSFCYGWLAAILLIGFSGVYPIYRDFFKTIKKNKKKGGNEAKGNNG
jgi:hypothetical protein